MSVNKGKTAKFPLRQDNHSPPPATTKCVRTADDAMDTDEPAPTVTPSTPANTTIVPPPSVTSFLDTFMHAPADTATNHAASPDTSAAAIKDDSNHYYTAAMLNSIDGFWNTSNLISFIFFVFFFLAL
ncbi:uncharacterized protein OCT59_010207 [Rhizophagus irregularis]|uniref:Uncharacterized protein n=3 Tax=Rhizophagus irregularis TaxID=588596 RepID=A0A916EEP0_9GLOM|nr:hypothetical protein OCT59_010207 [Rhizophagus irregularis]GBC38669.2 hypothetical protein GLOIN_2v1669804 [Rhizophagus irregularis DAOM 181602=DAOM 197198]CAB4387032.1 unnamed protein product [Rhizophagus irregularis]CAB4460799.1 unnamed protein product [Rhizophagus irregularis]CAB5164862.1 unnamed protein product [Rhizophagus irregularis]